MRKRTSRVLFKNETNMHCKKELIAIMQYEKECAWSYPNRKQIYNAKKNESCLIQIGNKYAMRKRTSRVLSKHETNMQCEKEWAVSYPNMNQISNAKNKIIK